MWLHLFIIELKVAFLDAAAVLQSASETMWIYSSQHNMKVSQGSNIQHSHSTVNTTHGIYIIFKKNISFGLIDNSPTVYHKVMNHDLSLSVWWILSLSVV